ncbi:uncharacterized TPR repeat-containing protein-like protein [Tanacetum coccineum]
MAKTIPDDMSPGKTIDEPTFSLTESSVGPMLSPGKIAGIQSPSTLPRRIFPGDMSSGKTIPGDMSPAKLFSMIKDAKKSELMSMKKFRSPTSKSLALEPINKLRSEKVRKVLQRFDSNEDGSLSREELATFIVATNPNNIFKEQLSTIIDMIFHLYYKFIDGDNCLSCDGLLLAYNDGLVDLDVDFEALRLELEPKHDHNKSKWESRVMKFIDKDKGLTFIGLETAYNKGHGDLDFDFKELVLKLKATYDHEDSLERDKGLNREELSALFSALTREKKFNEEHISVYLEGLFNFYDEFVDEKKGLTGVLRMYDDGFNDLDFDYKVLRLNSEGFNTTSRNLEIWNSVFAILVLVFLLPVLIGISWLKLLSNK